MLTICYDLLHLPISYSLRSKISAEKYKEDPQCNVCCRLFHVSVVQRQCTFICRECSRNPYIRVRRCRRLMVLLSVFQKRFSRCEQHSREHSYLAFWCLTLWLLATEH